MRWLLCLMLPLIACAASPLDEARRAQAMLGDSTWSRVIRVENTSNRGAYPAVVDALVFEEGGLLWFYTAWDGTQSLSLYRNQLAQEKENLAPLLREIDPGFTSYTFMPDAAVVPPPAEEEELQNGCFITCLAALRERVGRGERIERPRLLSCYATTPDGQRGHTVLTYETSRGFFLLDPARSARPRSVSRSFTEDPIALATLALRGGKVLKARWVDVDNPTPPRVARLGSSQSNLENMMPRLMQ